MIQTPQQTVCDVHRLLDDDFNLRPSYYCRLCDAMICLECQNDWGRRLKAALKRKLEPGYRGQPDYEKNIKGKI